MKHVLVESNWVFQVLEPSHRRVPEAEQLLQRGKNGELAIHIPHMCVKEGIRAIRNKRGRAERDVREYRRWLADEQRLQPEYNVVVTAFLADYVQHVESSLLGLEDAAQQIEDLDHVDVFALTADMIDEVLAFKYDRDIAKTNPLDEAILGAVIGRAKELRKADGTDSIYFCSTDKHLRPVHRDGSIRRSLKDLYDREEITVLANFNVP